MSEGPATDILSVLEELAGAIITGARARDPLFAARDVLDALWLTAHLNVEGLFAARATAPGGNKPPLEPTGLDTSTNHGGDSTPPPDPPPEPAPPVPPPPVDPPVPVYPFPPGPTGAPVPAGQVMRLFAPPALKDRRGVVRALRPVLTRGPSRRRETLHVQATVRRVATEHIWELVTQPVRERQLELTLVFDFAPSMDVWRGLTREISQTFTASCAFRSVRVVHALSRSGATPVIVLPTRAGIPDNVAPLATFKPSWGGGSAQSLCMIVSDCVSPHWRSAAWLKLIDHWSGTATVSILQVLPERFWSRTTLGDALRARAVASGRMISNHKFRLRPEHDLDHGEELPAIVDGAPEDALPAADGAGATFLPCASIFQTRGLQSLSRFLAGHADAMATCYRFASSAVAPDAQPPLAPPLEALESFRLHASRPARRLAALLAAAHAISLPLARIIEQAHMPDDGGPLVEAEVWLSGLLQPIKAAGSQPVNPDDILYEFRPGIREQLRDALSQALSREIVDTTSRFFEANIGRVGELRVLLSRPEEYPGLLSGTPAASPIAAIAADILRRSLGQFSDANPSDALRPVRELIALGGDDVCYRFAWSPDGRTLAVPTRGGILHLLNENGELTKALISSGGVNQVVWSPDGTRMAAACCDRNAKLLDPTGRIVTLFTDHNSDVRAVAFSPGSSLLATGTAGGSVRVFSVASFERLASHWPNLGAARALCWPRQDRLVVCFEGRAIIFELRDRRLEAIFTLDLDATSVEAIPRRPDVPQRLAFGLTGGAIQFVNLQTGEAFATLVPHRGAVLSISASDDGELLVTRSQDGTVALLTMGASPTWFASSPAPVSRNPNACVAIRPGSRSVAVAIDLERAVHLYDVAGLPVAEPESAESTERRELRVGVMGSITSDDERLPAFTDKARHIGLELAKHGHVLVISSAGARDADFHAFHGYLSASRSGRVIFVCPDDAAKSGYVSVLRQMRATVSASSKVDADLLSDALRDVYPIEAMLAGSLRRSFREVCEEATRKEWLFEWICELCLLAPDNAALHALRDRFFGAEVTLEIEAVGPAEDSEHPHRALAARVDALILMGNSRSTRAAWRVAREHGAPVIPDPAFGRAALSIWTQTREVPKSEDLPDSVNSDDPSVDISPTDIVDAIERLGQATNLLRGDEGSRESYRHRLLWVDDRPENNVQERRILEVLGLSVEIARSTEQGLAALRTEPFALIISDMGRVEGPREGYALLDALRTRGDRTPLLFYAGSSRPEHRAETERHGGQGCTNNSIELFLMVMRNLVMPPVRVNPLADATAAAAAAQGLKSSSAEPIAQSSTPAPAENSATKAAAIAPSQWVLVAGTGRSELSREDLDACNAIGQGLAASGYGLITGGWQGVDFFTAKSFAERVEAEGRDPSDWLRHIIARGKTAPFPKGKSESVAPGKLFDAAIRDADAVVLIAGSEGTAETGKAALRAGKPVVPLAWTGGEASKSHAAIQAEWNPLVFAGITRSEFGGLLDSGPERAARAIGLLQRLLEARKSWSGFLSEGEIRQLVELDLNTGETQRESMLLLSTKTQQTWLVATNLRLLCLLDDRVTRARNHVLQWSEPRERVGTVSADARLKSQTGLLDLPPHRQWYYSKRLHPSPGTLEKQVTSMLGRSDEPPPTASEAMKPPEPPTPRARKASKKKTSSKPKTSNKKKLSKRSKSRKKKK